MRFLELKIPPAVVVLVVAGFMWLVSGATPRFTCAFPGRPLAAGCAVLAGAGVIILGILSFRRARTTVNPLKPGAASSLVVAGIYRRTRNPMYLGAALILVGWALYLGNSLSLVPIALCVAYLNRFQIGPEERALEKLFGEEFRIYKARVSRWM